MEHIPWWDPESGLQHQPNADTEQDQSDDQLDDATGESLAGDRDQVPQVIDLPASRRSGGDRCSSVA